MIRYEIYQRTGLFGKSKWRWRAKSRNGEIIASGQAYSNKADALKAVYLLKGSGPAEIKTL